MIAAMLVWGAARAATISGHVYDADGEPATGVVMVAYDARLSYATDSSGPDGGYSISGLPPGPYRVRAAPSDASGLVDRFYPSAWDYCQADVVMLGEGDTVDGIDLTLDRGGSVAGRLLDSAGAAVAGATVVMEGVSARTALGMRVATTDSEGRFHAGGLDADPGSPESWRCFIDVAGFPQQYVGPTYDDEEADEIPVDLGEDVDLGEQVMLDGITVEGTVYGPTGPVTGGTVFVYASSQAIATSIAADGTYVGDGLPPGDVITWAESSGYATTYYPDADRPGDSVPAPDEGQVVTGVDLHLPYESTLMVAFTGDGDLGEVAVLLYNSTYTVGRGSPVAANGTVTIDALHPGDYTLYVYGSDGGFEDGFVLDGAGEPEVLTVDGPTALTIPLSRGATLSGTVLDDAGAPVYGAYVYATPATDDPAESAVTAADGTWEIRGLPAGSYTLDAQYVYYCPSDPGYVHVWWDGALVAEQASTLAIARGETREGLDFVLPVDGEHDGMADAWESENGLDPAADDAGGDADDDGFLNIDEYLLGTDPTSPDGAGGGCCGDGKGADTALVAVLGLALARRRGLRT